jgi:hypothetical protein
MMVIPPANSPPAPRPVRALPIINIVLLGATAQISDPNMNIAMIKMKTRFRLKMA